MSASKEERARKNDTSSSPPPADITPRLNETSSQQALVEQIEIALGRKPVKETRIDRKTGKVITFDRFKPNGLVVVRCLETAFRALQMYDGRLRDQDKPLFPHISQAYIVAYCRSMVAEWDAEHGPPLEASDNVLAGHQDQDRQQDDPGTSPTPADIGPTLNEKWAQQALVEQIEISLGRQPVKETQIERKTGTVSTFDRFKPDGLVVARCLEMAFRAQQMFNGRLRFQDEKLDPPKSRAETISDMRAYVRRYDEEHPRPAAADSVVADQHDQDHQHHDEAEAEPTLDQEMTDEPKSDAGRRPKSGAERRRTNPPGHFPMNY